MFWLWFITLNTEYPRRENPRRGAPWQNEMIRAAFIVGSLPRISYLNQFWSL